MELSRFTKYNQMNDVTPGFGRTLLEPTQPPVLAPCPAVTLPNNRPHGNQRPMRCLSLRSEKLFRVVAVECLFAMGKRFREDSGALVLSLLPAVVGRGLPRLAWLPGKQPLSSSGPTFPLGSPASAGERCTFN